MIHTTSNLVEYIFYPLRDLAAGYGYEVGAMRIPEHQRFVNHLIEKFNLKTTKFYNDTALNDYFINGVRVSDCLSNLNI